jgi:hypothetical protein
MASWAILLAATGFKVDAPNGRLTIAPPVRQDRLRAPWVSPTGWGTFEQSRAGFRLECREGTLAFKELAIRARGGEVAATLDGQTWPCLLAKEDGLLKLSFGREVRLEAGSTLVVT